MTHRRRLRRDKDPYSIQDSLNSVAASMGMDQPGALLGIIGRWESVVGPLVAAQVQPIEIRGRTLWLEVADPTWSTQLRYLQPEILTNIEREVGPDLVDEIAVRVKLRADE